MNPLILSLIGAVVKGFVPGGNIVQGLLSLGLNIAASKIPQHAEAIQAVQQVIVNNPLVASAATVASNSVTQNVQFTADHYVQIINTLHDVVHPFLPVQDQAAATEIRDVLLACKNLVSELLHAHSAATPVVTEVNNVAVNPTSVAAPTFTDYNT